MRSRRPAPAVEHGSILVGAERRAAAAGPNDSEAGETDQVEPSGLVGRIDHWQRSHRVPAFAVGVIKKFGDDQAGRLAALIAYYGFFSLFPALLALVTVVGFVLQDRPDLRTSIEESALAQFPVIGDSIGGAVSQPLSGSTLALVVGILGALWAGMGAMQAAQDAMNEVWDVPRADYPGFLSKRLRSLGLLGLVGVMLIGTAVLPSIVGFLLDGAATTVVLLVVTFAIDIGVFLVAFRVLTVAEPTWRQLVPGACVAGVAYAMLQLVGTLYVTRTLDGAQSTYGTFAVVIGLLSWIYLLAQVTMFAAEVNVVAASRLWPRSLAGKPPTRSDHQSATAQVEQARTGDDMVLDVRFAEPAVPDPGDSSG